jgi:hypothetical protein
MLFKVFYASRNKQEADKGCFKNERGRIRTNQYIVSMEGKEKVQLMYQQRE